MQTAMDRERAIMGQRMQMQAPQGGMAQGGLQPPQGGASPPMGGQQPPGAGPAVQGQGQPQPSPGFQEALSTVFNTLMQGNEADMQLFAAAMGQLDAMSKQHQAEMGQGPSMPQQPGIPSTP